MVTLGTQLRYWSYSSSAAEAYKSRKRGQLRRRSDRGSHSTPEQKYHHTGRGVLRDIIADERLELESEKTNKRKEQDRLASRFGTSLLGEGASEEEMLAYATMLSEESYTSDAIKRYPSPPSEAPATPTDASRVAEQDAELDEAIRLSLLDTDAAYESSQSTNFDVPIRYGRKSKHSTPSKPVLGSSSQTMRSKSEEELEFALQLSKAEEESKLFADEHEFPTLAKSNSGSSVEGKGKGKSKRR